MANTEGDGFDWLMTSLPRIVCPGEGRGIELPGEHLTGLFTGLDTDRHLAVAGYELDEGADQHRNADAVARVGAGIGATQPARRRSAQPSEPCSMTSPTASPQGRWPT